MQKFEKIEKIEIEIDLIDEIIEKLHRRGIGKDNKERDMEAMNRLISERDELFNELCKLGQAV